MAFALLHVCSRLVRKKELSALDLRERSLDLGSGVETLQASGALLVEISNLLHYGQILGPGANILL